MCDDLDWDSEVLDRRRIRARKGHRCGECRRAIQKGDEYVRTAILCDHAVSDYKLCLRCTRIESAHMATERSMGNSGGYLVGELTSTIKECIAEDPHYVVAFRAAWKGEPVPKKPPLADRRQYSTVA